MSGPKPRKDLARGIEVRGPILRGAGGNIEAFRPPFRAKHGEQWVIGPDWKPSQTPSEPAQDEEKP